MKIWQKHFISSIDIYQKGNSVSKFLETEKIHLSTQTPMYIAKRTSNVPYKQSNKQKQC